MQRKGHLGIIPIGTNSSGRVVYVAQKPFYSYQIPCYVFGKAYYQWWTVITDEESIRTLYDAYYKALPRFRKTPRLDTPGQNYNEKRGILIFHRVDLN